MVGNIIGLVSCLMCAVPFFILSAFGKDSDEPINFWSGDTTRLPDSACGRNRYHLSELYGRPLSRI